jgi:outer membrane biosynthesis protein TonB
MDRAEAKGLGASLVGHGALLAALTLGISTAVSPPPPQPPPMEVSLVDEVALTAASPQVPAEPPAQAMAPAAGPAEDAAPAAEPAPTPLPAPPIPAPRRAEPLPSPERAPPQPVREPPRPAPRQAAPTARTPRPAAPTSGKAEQTRRPLLGSELLRGIGRDPSPSRNPNPPGAVMSASAAADIASAISRQIQPCADRQVYPGPGAERIVTPVMLRLNRDGSLAGRPRVGQQRGLDDENSRYAQRVADLAVNSFVACSPLRGLPSELYDVPRGWSNFTMNYRLPS